MDNLVLYISATRFLFIQQQEFWLADIGIGLHKGPNW